ncbi:MAG: 16S rRNA methyltransferase [Anaerolineae bacterium]|nr:16S rRNA methyltransferase [Anaerolineae bacterium]
MVDEQELKKLVEQVQASSKYGKIHPAFIERVAAGELGIGRRPKETLKAVKNKLHQVGGAYLRGDTNFSAWLEVLKQAAGAGDPQELKTACADIMGKHASTRERLPILEEFYAAIFADLPPVHSVLDLACGLNPLAIPWMPLAPDAAYYACDIYGDMTAFIDKFLALVPVQGKAWACDLIGEPPTQRVDLALLLKTLPVLEQVEKGAGSLLLDAIQADYLLVSYPVSSLGGKDKGMVDHYDGEFREMVKGRGWELKKFVFKTELAFLVNKTTDKRLI